MRPMLLIWIIHSVVNIIHDYIILSRANNDLLHVFNKTIPRMRIHIPDYTLHNNTPASL